jgi:hypothetical protein
MALCFSDQTGAMCPFFVRKSDVSKGISVIFCCLALRNGHHSTKLGMVSREMRAYSEPTALPFQGAESEWNRRQTWLWLPPLVCRVLLPARRHRPFAQHAVDRTRRHALADDVP